MAWEKKGVDCVCFFLLSWSSGNSILSCLCFMVIGRLLYGVGIGVTMHVAPMHIAETTPSKIRGQLICLKEFFIAFGMLVGYTVVSLLIETVAGWRYMYRVGSSLAVIMGIGIWWLPLSPRWILMCAIQGKGDFQGLREKAICCF